MEKRATIRRSFGKSGDAGGPSGKPVLRMPFDYRELGIITIPEDVPELGVKAGDSGTITGVYENGRLLDVEIDREDGTSAGFVDLRIDRSGAPHVVGFSSL